MISMTREELEKRARGFLRRLRRVLPMDVHIQLSSGNSLVGGGSCPEYLLPTTLVVLDSSRTSPNSLESRLRSQDPAIVLRIEEDKALIDLRTVFPDQESALIVGLQKAFASQ
jgi:L-seryl-tRNA(Ser) seleniumtransferase